jgi:hypothetical protein
MKLHFAFAGIAAMMLCACTAVRGPGTQDLSFETTPIVFAPPPPGFCEDVAASDRLRVQMAGFDLPTVDRIATQSLQQCRSLLALSPNVPAARVVFAAR